MDFDLLKTPAPTITTLTRPFWDAAEQGRLVIQHCEACDRAVFYPRPICPHCWSDRLTWKEASGQGRIKSFSVVHRPGHPGWLPIAPFMVALIELKEGPTMLSIVVGSHGGDLSVGDAVRLRPTRIGGRILPAFEPSTATG